MGLWGLLGRILSLRFGVGIRGFGRVKGSSGVLALPKCGGEVLVSVIRVCSLCFQFAGLRTRSF